MNAKPSDSIAVRQLARDLGMKRQGNPLAFLIAHCRRVVEAWAAEFEAETLADLLLTVAAKVGLVVEYIETDSDLRAVTAKYVARGEGGFARVPAELNEKTFALVFRLRDQRHGCTHAAVIDCRGPKAARRWFSTWHEIAHLLVQPQLSFQFRRTGIDEKDPVEAAMDAIAGELGYLDRFYRLELPPGGRLSLDILEAHRLRSAPEASIQSAYATAVVRHEDPVVLIVAELGLKAGERRAMRIPGTPRAEPRLRAVSVVGSESTTDAGFHIPKNIRVPKESVITRVYQGGTSEERKPVAENLAHWESAGRQLPDKRVLVEAAKFGSRVLALVTLLD